jgi:hypothetical protein
VVVDAATGRAQTAAQRHTGVNVPQSGGIDDWDGLKALALGLGLPELSVGLSWNQETLKAHGKFLACWSRYVDAAVIHCHADERDMLMAADAETFILHPHYLNSPYVLVRAGRIDPGWVAARLKARWRELAPKRWLRSWDAARAVG